MVVLSVRNVIILYVMKKKMRNEQNLKFVFVHIPRTAGTTFKRMLRDIGFAGKADNTELLNIDGNREFSRKMSGKLIQGHFPVRKYLDMKGYKYITILRDPVDRLVSQYYWYKMRGIRGNCIVSKDVRRRICSGDMDLLSFAKLMSGLYRKMLGSNMNLYSWIGIQEKFNESLREFENTFGIRIPKRIKNWNITEKKKIEGRARIAKILSDDYKIYNEVLSEKERND